MKILKRQALGSSGVGIESGHQDVLDAMKKKLTVPIIKEFFNDAKKTGILIHGCFLVGNPGETKETLEKDIKACN